MLSPIWQHLQLSVHTCLTVSLSNYRLQLSFYYIVVHSVNAGWLNSMRTPCPLLSYRVLWYLVSLWIWIPAFYVSRAVRRKTIRLLKIFGLVPCYRINRDEVFKYSCSNFTMEIEHDFFLNIRLKMKMCSIRVKDSSEIADWNVHEIWQDNSQRTNTTIETPKVTNAWSDHREGMKSTNHFGYRKSRIRFSSSLTHT